MIKNYDNGHLVRLRILKLGMDTQTPTGKLMLSVLGDVAQFEREMILERQKKEGIAKTKTAGKYKGRKPVSDDLPEKVVSLVAEGKLKVHIARQLNIGEATVYRILAVW